ncbi:hypothetical protein EMCRGX_G028351 [Ephydatia muelleri]
MFNHAAQLPSNFIPLWTTELDPCQGQCCLCSEQEVQQWDPLGLLLFSLVLNILVPEITFNGVYADLSYYARYLDWQVPGVRSSAVVICQLISPAMKRSSSPNLVILSIPIGDQALEKHVEAKALWIKLIHMWPSSGSASWPMVHHPLKLCEPLKPLTMASISCFSRCTAVDTYLIRQQAELSLICVEDALTSPILQKVLSNKVDIYQFNMAMKNSSLADKAHQPSVSSSHAASWIYVILLEGAHLSAKVEGGSNLTHDHTHSRPANILFCWKRDPQQVWQPELRSRGHEANDAKCKELGWVCVPMVVEAYGAWGGLEPGVTSRLASRLATSSNEANFTAG